MTSEGMQTSKGTALSHVRVWIGTSLIPEHFTEPAHASEQYQHYVLPE